MLVACHGNKQKKIGVGVKADEVDDVRATRSRVSSVGASLIPRSMGTARAPVAIPTEKMVERKRMVVIGN